jgi:hypothetical protein
LNSPYEGFLSLAKTPVGLEIYSLKNYCLDMAEAGSFKTLPEAGSEGDAK